MASIVRDIERAVQNSGGSVSAPHHNIMAKLRLEGVTRSELDKALDGLRTKGYSVIKTETHTTIRRGRRNRRKKAA